MLCKLNFEFGLRCLKEGDATAAQQEAASSQKQSYPSAPRACTWSIDLILVTEARWCCHFCYAMRVTDKTAATET